MTAPEPCAAAVEAAARASEYCEMRWPGDSSRPTDAECMADARSALTAAWPLIEREVLARAADQLEAEYEDMAKRFGRLATVRARLESKKAVVDALRTLADRALVPPTGEGVANG